MTLYRFKLMASLDESGEREIEISKDPNISVGDVKVLVKQAFKFAPSIQVSLIVEGKTLSDDHHKWNKVVSINPRKDVIRVIGTR